MLLNVANVSKTYGVDIILSGLSFKLENREKVALVGRNGAGKTTLLKLITKQIEPTTGTVVLARGAKVGYLRQEVPVDAGRTVLEEAQTALEDELSKKARLDELEKIIESADFSDDDLDEYTLLHEHFLDSEGFSAEHDVKVVLLKMGFTEDEFNKPTAKLSGGEKTRLAIARLLLEEPDLLILDEPTNHLDLQATEWLEGWIRGYHGAVLLVSHDRTFLDATAERVLEMREGTVKAYPGPFEKFLLLREEEDRRLAEVAKRQDQEIDKMDEFVRRFMNSQRTAQARGREKLMNRLIENKVEGPKQDQMMKGGFGAVKRSGDIVLDAQKLTVGFDNPEEGRTVLIDKLDWTVRFGERWGVIGENGAGKSTLIKVMLDELEALGGKAKIGAGVTEGYFTQDAVDLDPEKSPLDTMVYEMDLKPPEARNLLAKFLIQGDDVYRPIKTLSGGEKNKLSLAKLTHLNPNLLVLDEPTNHLDMASREALVNVIRDYQGTLVLISHDRYLLTQVTNHTLDIRKSGPILYPGGYAEYRDRANKPAPELLTKGKGKAAAPVAVATPAMSPRELSKEIGRLEKVIEGLENDISEYEGEIKDIEHQLADLPASVDVISLTHQYQRVKAELERAETAWEEQSTRLELLRIQQG